MSLSRIESFRICLFDDRKLVRSFTASRMGVLSIFE